ncbi:ABC transporter substrate-binding protein [Jeotgalibacillus marinus]|uniref:ABC transporter substrate-binding protein n=1 Tax=Jeotgalibacillus marinus TaxID=86667 RepID=A0ABV3Q0K6_9BACL
MKNWKWMISLLVALGLLAACGDPDTETGSDSEQSVETAFPVTITDATGEEVTIDEEPKAIVSMIPSNTEIVYALGLDEEIVGVSDFDNYPEEAEDVEKIGGMEFNVEKIISLQPDVVLAHDSNSTQEDGLKQIEDAGITVVVIENATSFDQVYDTIDTIGKVTGKVTEAEQVIEDMQDGFAEIEEKAATVEEADRKKVLIAVSQMPDVYVAGNDTFMQEMLDLIQADNAAGEQDGFPMLAEEEIVRLNPDTVVVTSGYYEENLTQEWLTHGSFSDLTAVQNEDIQEVSSDPVNRSGPRLVEGAQELAEAIYPDIFSE